MTSSRPGGIRYSDEAADGPELETSKKLPSSAPEMPFERDTFQGSPVTDLARQGPLTVRILYCHLKKWPSRGVSCVVRVRYDGSKGYRRMETYSGVE